MCLGSPAVVLQVDYENMAAVVDYGDGVPRTVIVGISGERVKRGDIVIVHAGVVVSKISEEEVLEQVKFFKEELGEDVLGIASLYSALLEKSRELRGSGK